jgi:hypothetical protein
MAKFRQGDLVLAPAQKITNNNEDVLINAGGVANFTSLEFAAGETISEFDADVALTADSDTKVPTQKAVKTYVDTQVSGAVPPGTDHAIVRYNLVNSVQDSGIFIDDSDNITGVNDLTVDGTATIATSLFCDDLYVSGDTLFVGTGQIKSTSGNVELYYNGVEKFRTTDNGFNWGDWENGGEECRFQFAAGEMLLDCTVIDAPVALRGTDNGDNPHIILYGDPNAGCRLYYDAQQKFITTNTGATVTGILVADGLTLGDNEDITFGAGPDAKISSNGTTLVIENGAGNETMARFTQNGTVQLYYNNLLQLQTFTNGFGFGQTTSYLKTSSGANAIGVIDQGAVEFYYDGAKIGETTSNGISGAVWG